MIIRRLAGLASSCGRPVRAYSAQGAKSTRENSRVTVMPVTVAFNTQRPFQLGLRSGNEAALGARTT